MPFHVHARPPVTTCSCTTLPAGWCPIHPSRGTALVAFDYRAPEDRGLRPSATPRSTRRLVERAYAGARLARAGTARAPCGSLPTTWYFDSVSAVRPARLGPAAVSRSVGDAASCPVAVRRRFQPRDGRRVHAGRGARRTPHRPRDGVAAATSPSTARSSNPKRRTMALGRRRSSFRRPVPGSPPAQSGRPGARGAVTGNPPSTGLMLNRSASLPVETHCNMRQVSGGVAPCTRHAPPRLCPPRRPSFARPDGGPTGWPVAATLQCAWGGR